MNKLPYIVALEIGSSKIVGAIASVSPRGTVSVLALEEEPSHESVRYGCIKNLEDTANKVADIIAKLETKAQVTPQSVKSVFTGQSGRSLHSETRKTSMPLTDGEPVSADIIERMKHDVTFEKSINGMEILDIVPSRFMVDNMESIKPVGSVGNKIDGEFTVILGKEQLRANLRRVLSDRNGLEIKGNNITILAEAQQVLTAEERRLGALLVNVGAETTTVVIYKKGAPVYIYTMPIGSRNITRDITSLNILEENAEDIKKSIGNAKEVATLAELKLNGGIKAIDAGNLIVARAGEIVANIYAQLEAAGLTIADIPEGVIVTGGGANLKNFVELISEHFGVKARLGNLANKDLKVAEPVAANTKKVAEGSYKKVTEADLRNPAHMSILSILLEAASKLKPGESCCQDSVNVAEATPEVPVAAKTPVKQPDKEIKKKTKENKPNPFTKFFNKVKNLADSAFEDEKDDEDE
ncbi:MAG: cell division protein FtsA [Muribaculaceae bacterium]|nr:cell division protein FtsA [Muribaculaceae bacterium]